ncbi:MAG: trehalose-phosphatase, partial [Candidatus Limnocylindrales bacterium]
PFALAFADSQLAAFRGPVGCPDRGADAYAEADANAETDEDTNAHAHAETDGIAVAFLEPGSLGHAESQPDVTSARALAARVAAPAGRILVILDFDGTLAEIDPDPLGARIDSIALRALRRLARFGAARPERLSLAILTGRAVPDVVARVRVGGLRYLGNHGLEARWLPRHGNVRSLVGSPAGDVGAGGAAEGAALEAARLGQGVSTALGTPAWLFVELKGGSVAFHYRRAPDPEAAGRAIGEAVDARLAAGGLALERFDGRMIVELRPAGAGGKGAAVGRLLNELAPASVLALGDDRSDVEGFRVIASERAAGQSAALNVGIRDRTATPVELVEVADVMLDAPRDAGRLLGALATELERGS